MSSEKKHLQQQADAYCFGASNAQGIHNPFRRAVKLSFVP